MNDNRISTDDIAKEYINQDNPTGWFDEIYAAAKTGQGDVPWANMRPHVDLVDWLVREKTDGAGRTALKIGCGLGDDAEELDARGFDVTAFDISATAIDWCCERFLNSRVNYDQADLFGAPPHWEEKFDFVLEIYTLQALPETIRQKAVKEIAGFVAPGGQLLVINIYREDNIPASENPPWPLTRQEILDFETFGLVLEREENYVSHQFDTPLPHSRMLFRHP